MSTPLAATRPLWQIHLVDGVGEGSAVIVRVHHCIADGVSLVRLLLELADQAPREPVKVGRLREPMRGPLERLSLLADEARALARLLLLAPDPPTPLSVPLGTRKRAAWSDAIPLDRLVAIAHAQDGTLNDVLLAATTAALRRDLERRLALVPALEVRAMMPVNLRPVEGAAEELGNRFGLVYVPLPLGTAAPLPRLREVKRRLDEIKASPEAAVSLGVLGVMGLLTASAERLGVDLFTHKSTVLATNVPGPPTPMRIAGQLLRRLLVWAPVSGRMGISFSFLSYAGTLTLGLGADEGCMPDPDAVVRDFVADLDALAAAATP